MYGDKCVLGINTVNFFRGIVVFHQYNFFNNLKTSVHYNFLHSKILANFVFNYLTIFGFSNIYKESYSFFDDCSLIPIFRDLGGLVYHN